MTEQPAEQLRATGLHKVFTLYNQGGLELPVLGGLYELMFGERRDGSFVEVGAFDGETYGNTACLADLGWRGVYVEPVAKACERCRARHAGTSRAHCHDLDRRLCKN